MAVASAGPGTGAAAGARPAGRRSRRPVGWLVACILAAGAAFVVLRLVTPGDGTQVPPRTWAWTGGYAVVVLGCGQLLGHDSSLVVAAATLAVAEQTMQPTQVSLCCGHSPAAWPIASPAPTGQPRSPVPSSTSSTRTPWRDLGWTKAMVVPPEPVRGAGSITSKPWARRSATAAATSGTA